MLMGFIGLIGFIGFIVGIISLAIKSKKRVKIGKTILTTIIMFVLFFVGITHLPEDTSNKNAAQNTSAVAESSTDTPAKEDTVQTDSSNENLSSLVASSFKNGEITKNGNELTIQFKPDALTENTFVTIGLNSTALGFDKVYKNKEFKKFKVVHVKIMTTFTNESGNNTNGLGMELTFDQDKIQTVKDFGNMTPEQVVTLEGNYRTGVASSIKSKLSAENLKMLYPNN